ncbi:MAG: hypothetical protein H0V62_02275 [Gammaproteobacteria bacterium]|nr:hypothetical protein [Gammaproteobacteria bacterium]
MSSPTRLSEAIDSAMADIASIEAHASAGSLRLGEIEARLIALARSATFASMEPPAAGATGIYYVLSEPTDPPYGLYLNVAPAGNRAPPHCHGVWCVAVGFRGEETNRFYRFTAGQNGGAGNLDELESRVLAPGAGMCMRADDIHSVDVSGAGPVAHLHLYARRLSQFPELVVYDTATGSRRTAPAPVPKRLDSGAVN